MFEFYNPDYSIDIYNDSFKANTWETWHLIPNERPSIAPPEVKTQYVEIPGMNGALDYTEVLSGDVRYGNRQGSWEFIVETGVQKWCDLYNELLTLLHGKRFNCVLREQPNYIYNGRLEVNQWKSDERYSTITIDYNFSPYKSVKEGAITDWLWDDLTFNSNVYVIYYGSFIVDGRLPRNIFNPTNDPVEIILTVSDTMDVRLPHSIDVKRYYANHVYGNDDSYTHRSGIILSPFSNPSTNGNNEVEFMGYGKVTINYSRGVNNI